VSKYVTRDALIDVLKTRHPTVFVEAGTFQARVTQLALEFFIEVHTIEASPPLYHAARAKLQGTVAQTYLGDARLVIRDLAKSIVPATFWYLDANGWKYPDVVQDCPVLDLVRALARRPAGDVIVIDEAHAFGSSRPGWGAVTVDAIGKILGVTDVRLAHNCAVIYR